MLDKKRNNWRGAIIAGTLSLLIIVSVAWVIFNRQFVSDQLSYMSYSPSSAIAGIADRVEFTDKGKFYFYATNPSLDEAEDFNKNCPRQEVGSPIIGCYSFGKIYIYDIDNKDLDGIKEVTAAHEMLHAAWERLSPSEKKRLTVLLEDEYKKVSNNDLRKRMDYYARTEPDQITNELHSIVGTEVRSISSELEEYYSQYFKDRTVVLDLYDSYYSVFNKLYKQSEKIYTELVALGNDIDTRSKQYRQDVSQLSADINSFNNRAASGYFSSMDQFYAERQQLVNRSNNLAATRSKINNDIQRYDKKYNDYSAIIAQIEALNRSLDSFSRLEPVPSID